MWGDATGEFFQWDLLEAGEGSALPSKTKADFKGREQSGCVPTLLKNIMGLSPIGLNRRLAKESAMNQQSEKRADIRRCNETTNSK